MTDPSQLSARALAYAELISGRKGQAAIVAWLRFTGWIEAQVPRRKHRAVTDGGEDTGRLQRPLGARLQRLEDRARAYESQRSKLGMAT